MGFFKKLKKGVKKVGKVVGSVASKAAPIAALVPGVGTLGAAALGAGGALAAGKGLKGAIGSGLGGALGGLAIGGMGLTGALGKLGTSGGLASLGQSFLSGGGLGKAQQALGLFGGSSGGGSSGGGYERPGLGNTFRQNETKTTSTLSLADQNVMRQLSSTLAGNAAQYTRANALADSRGVVDSITRQLRENAIPQILSGQVEAGGYNSTGSTALANDAVQRASETASNLAMDQINKYGALQTNNLTGAATVMDALKGVNTTETSSISRDGGPGGITGKINEGLDLVSSLGKGLDLFSGVFGKKNGSTAADDAEMRAYGGY